MSKYKAVIKVEVYDSADQEEVDHKYEVTGESIGQKKADGRDEGPERGKPEKRTKRATATKRITAEDIEENKSKKRKYDKQRYLRMHGKEEQSQDFLVIKEKSKDNQQEQDDKGQVKSKRNLPSKIKRLTPEQIAEANRKAAELRKKRRKSMTPEQRAEENRKRAELMRKKRESMTPEQRAEENRKHAERQRKKRESMTPEQRAEVNRKHVERQRKMRENLRGEQTGQERRRAKQGHRKQQAVVQMTEEKRKEHRLKRYFYSQAWRYRKKCEDENWSEEMKEKSRKHFKEWVRNLTGEKKRRYMESVSKAHKKWLAKCKAENNESWKRHQEKLRESQKRRLSKMKEENSEKWRQHQEKLREYERKRLANETPEERLRRHHKYKVNTAARKLKQRLADEQVAEDEIERQVVELKTALWREFDPDYDKRPQKRKGPRRKVTPPPENEQPTATKDQEKDDCDANETYHHDEGKENYSHDDAIEDCPSVNSDNVTEFEENLESDPLVQHSTPNDDRLSTSCIQCPHCPSVFLTDIQLHPHVSSVHPEKCWKCPKCAEVMFSPMQLSQHYNSSHKTEEQKQVSPNENTAQQTNLPFLCMRCPLLSSGQASKFGSRQELFSHVKAKHSQHYWPCKRCNLLKYSETALKLHMSLCRS